ncbi:LOW QUALITY PROTEIN: AP-4 complex accessory subunit tepsin [Rhynchocyon petersi]
MIGRAWAWRKQSDSEVAGIMAAVPQLRDRLSFLHRVSERGNGLALKGGSSGGSFSFQLPILLKGTSDDDIPCPGYLFEEIANISHESPGSSQCLLEYLLTRLQSSSGHVKLKVLKILLYLCSHGSSSFLLTLKRNAAFIQEATVFAGPPDPLHGNSLYQKVRLAAQDLGSALFSDTVSPPPAPRVSRQLTSTGMGSQPHSGLQGFGYSQERGRGGSAGEAFLSTIQKAADMVVKAMRPGQEWPGPQRPVPGGSTYQPAVTPLVSHGHGPPERPLPGVGAGARALRHQPGQPGGGWEELDSSPSSQGSSQNGGWSRTSDCGSGCVSDGHLGAGREPSELAERMEAMALSDFQPEATLVRAVTRGSRAFLSREEAQHFLKECGLLNCEAILELLIRHLDGTQECEQMRALCALSALGSADLMSQEHVFLLARTRLQALSLGSPGPVTSKATKILRHFEASCQHRTPPWVPLAEPSPTVPRDAGPCPPDLLTDTMPFSGNPLSLQPLSPSLLLPNDTDPPGNTYLGQASSGEAKRGLAGPQGSGSKSDPLDGGPEPDQGLKGCPWVSAASGSNSLFEGMELVGCPRPMHRTEAPTQLVCEEVWSPVGRHGARCRYLKTWLILEPSGDPRDHLGPPPKTDSRCVPIGSRLLPAPILSIPFHSLIGSACRPVCPAPFFRHFPRGQWVSAPASFPAHSVSFLSLEANGRPAAAASSPLPRPPLAARRTAEQPSTRPRRPAARPIGARHGGGRASCGRARWSSLVASRCFPERSAAAELRGRIEARGCEVRAENLLPARGSRPAQVRRAGAQAWAPGDQQRESGASGPSPSPCRGGGCTAEGAQDLPCPDEPLACPGELP